MYWSVFAKINMGILFSGDNGGQTIFVSKTGEITSVICNVTSKSNMVWQDSCLGEVEKQQKF